MNEILTKNLAKIDDEVRDACRRVSRSPTEVTLVAVTKYAPWPAVQQLAQQYTVFGESRPQQLAERAAKLPFVDWHLIGQLQRNKVPLAVKHAALIHSVDSIKLLERIQQLSRESQVAPAVLLQVNMSREDAKSGFDADELRRLWPDLLRSSSALDIQGLMTMAADSDDPEDARPVFRALRQLRDDLAAVSRAAESCFRLPQLSMGMSGDFVPAIEEGATLIRIGSRLFEGIEADQ